MIISLTDLITHRVAPSIHQAHLVVPPLNDYGVAHPKDSIVPLRESERWTSPPIEEKIRLWLTAIVPGTGDR